MHIHELKPGHAQLTPEQLAAKNHKQQAQAIFELVTDHLHRKPLQSLRLLQSWIYTP
jgi:hypothetical protein